MIETFKGDKFNYQKLSQEEQSKRGILGRLVGVIADSKRPTRNGRKYSAELWENVFKNPIMQEKINNRVCYGELCHPFDGRQEVDPEKVAICLAEVPKMNENGELVGVFDVLNTPCGKILKTMLDYGSNIGVSSRGNGDLIDDVFGGGESVDPNTYDCVCWDAVFVPAVKAARLQLVSESLENKRNLKNELSRLVEGCEDDNDKRVMQETLKTLALQRALRENLKDTTLQVTYEDADGEEKVVYFKCNKNYSSLNSKALASDIKSQYSDIKSITNISESKESVPEKEDEEKEILTEKERYKDSDIVSGSDDDMHELFQKLMNGESVEDVLDWADKKGMVQKDALKITEIEEPSSTEDVNHKEELKDDEADDDGSEILTELQESLVANKNYQSQIKQLQEELSVCYAKEKALTEKTERQKDSIQLLIENRKKVEMLKEQLEKQSDVEVENKKLLESKDSTIAYQKSVLEKYEKQNKERCDSTNALKEELNNSKEQYKGLCEKYQTLYSKAKTVQDRYNALKEHLTEEKKEFDSQLKELKLSHEKDLRIKESSYRTELKKQKELVEKCNKNTQYAVDRYIQLQSNIIGCKPEEIKSRLGENYNFKQIDEACDNMVQYNVNISRLPVQINKSSVRLTEGSDIRNRLPHSNDDTITAEHLMLAGLL